jgi:hypothetical protein
MGAEAKLIEDIPWCSSELRSSSTVTPSSRHSETWSLVSVWMCVTIPADCGYGQSCQYSLSEKLTAATPSRVLALYPARALALAKCVYTIGKYRTYSFDREAYQVKIVLDHVELEVLDRQSTIAHFLDKLVLCEFFPDFLNILAL